MNHATRISVITVHEEIYVYVSDGVNVIEASARNGKWFLLLLKTYLKLIARKIFNSQ